MKLEEKLKELKLEQDIEFDKSVSKSIKKSLTHMTVKVIIVIIVILALVVLTLNFVICNFYTNPEKLNKVYSDNDKSVLLNTINTYLEGQYPYIMVNDISVKNKGFSNYSLDMNIRHLIKGTSNVTFGYFSSQIEIQDDPNDVLMVEGSRFMGSAGGTNQKEIISDFEKLPESAYIYVSITDKKEWNIQELLKQDITFNWLKVLSEGDYTMGLNLYNESEDVIKNIKEMYLNKLQLLYDNYDIWKDLGPFLNGYNNNGKNMIKTAIEDVNKSETLKTNQYCISGEKEQILEYLRNNELSFIYVDEVKVSKY